MVEKPCNEGQPVGEGPEVCQGSFALTWYGRAEQTRQRWVIDDWRRQKLALRLPTVCPWCGHDTTIFPVVPSRSLADFLRDEPVA